MLDLYLGVWYLDLCPFWCGFDEIWCGFGVVCCWFHVFWPVLDSGVCFGCLCNVIVCGVMVKCVVP